MRLYSSPLKRNDLKILEAISLSDGTAAKYRQFTNKFSRPVTFVSQVRFSIPTCFTNSANHRLTLCRAYLDGRVTSVIQESLSYLNIVPDSFYKNVYIHVESRDNNLVAYVCVPGDYKVELNSETRQILYSFVRARIKDVLIAENNRYN